MMAAPDSNPQVNDDEEGRDFFDLALPLAQCWKLLLIAPLLVGLLALAATYLLAETFTARTVFLPPQQQQSAAASALSQLGALSGLAGLGGAASVKSPADQYVALLQSANVSDAIIDKFDLLRVYDVEYRARARQQLAKNTQVTLGKKDGLITIDVADESSDRAAKIANRFVEELRRLTVELAVTEAQQRRVFFETQLAQTRDRLTAAQQALQASGFSQGALRADARASAEGYARLRAEATATEVRLQTLRRSLADSAPEVQQALTTLAALRAQLAKFEQTTDLSSGPDYVSKFREFKYQETLFDLFARQYELARVDESREGALIQVVDVAQPPERKSWPKRGVTAVVATVGTLLLLIFFVWMRHLWREASRNANTAPKVASLRASFGRR